LNLPQKLNALAKNQKTDVNIKKAIEYGLGYFKLALAYFHKKAKEGKYEATYECYPHDVHLWRKRINDATQRIARDIAATLLEKSGLTVAPKYKLLEKSGLTVALKYKLFEYEDMYGIHCSWEEPNV
jgi:hypothetical protein